MKISSKTPAAAHLDSKAVDGSRKITTHSTSKIKSHPHIHEQTEHSKTKQDPQHSKQTLKTQVLSGHGKSAKAFNPHVTAQHTIQSQVHSETICLQNRATGNQTCILAKKDIGFGNTLFVRGEGPGLSWEVGIPMENKGAEEWIYTLELPSNEQSVQFKCLINDEVWSVGDNIQVETGTIAVYVPEFE